MSEKKRKELFLASGYSRASFVFNGIFNFVLALFLLILALPAFLIVSLIILTKEGGRPVFYKGTRLGKSKEPFTMYKFRTLSKDAESIIGGHVLSQQVAVDRKLQSDFGKFLRFSRLDELPQLFNILKGEMEFLGPRPERPAVYEKYCKQIPGYDKRFLVKPGLIGYSQLFTPHSAPRRIRALIDNRALMIKQNCFKDFMIVIYTIAVLAVRLHYIIIGYLWNRVIKRIIVHSYDREKRHLDRVRLHAALVRIEGGDGGSALSETGMLMDINEEALLVYCDGEIPHTDLTLRMTVDYKSILSLRKRHKTAVCHGTIMKRIELRDKGFRYAYVVNYTPVSPLNSYLVHQYFLHESIV